MLNDERNEKAPNGLDGYQQPNQSVKSRNDSPLSLGLNIIEASLLRSEIIAKKMLGRASSTLRKYADLAGLVLV